jgi:hypothetical protein
MWCVGAQRFRGFFRGLSAAMLRAFPVNAVTFLVYDSLLDVFDPSHPHSAPTDDPPLT